MHNGSTTSAKLQVKKTVPYHECFFEDGANILI